MFDYKLYYKLIKMYFIFSKKIFFKKIHNLNK